MRFLDILSAWWLLQEPKEAGMGTLQQEIHAVNPLPAPQRLEWQTGGAVYLASEPVYGGPDSDLLRQATARAWKSMLQTPFSCTKTGKSEKAAPVVVLNGAALAGIRRVDIEVADTHADLQLGVDESYSLDVTTDGIHVSANTTWGALHALTTLEQLACQSPEAGMRPHLPRPVHIEDRPLYTHRGLMIDTARNFYSVSSLKRQIDAMALAKLNVFHWHLTDHQAWPVYVQSHPEMVKDAYSPAEVYMPADVSDIVDYARARGVRVVPELDLPGHSNAGWKRANPDVVVCGNAQWTEAAVEPVPGQLNVLSNATYHLLADVYGDLRHMFRDTAFHVGFDELNTGCYDMSDSIQKWMRAGNRSYHDLTDHWVQHALPIFRRPNDNRTTELIMWQDAVLAPDTSSRAVPKDVIMQSWTGGQDSISKLLNKGHRVIVSASDFLYLDCGFGGWMPNDHDVADQRDPSPGTPSYNYGGSGGSWCAPYKTWQRIYALDFAANITHEQRQSVLGAEAALWSEQSDSTNVDQMVWPRAAALGELVWSGNSHPNGTSRALEFRDRIFLFRERLVARGVNAAPIGPKYCLQHPGACDLP